MYTAKYDENSGTGTLYLETSKVRRQDESKVEHKLPITEDCNIHGKLLDGTNYKIVPHAGESKSFISVWMFLILFGRMGDLSSRILYKQKYFLG